MNSFETVPGRGPVCIIVAHFCSAVLWLRPSQEMEKHWEKGCTCGISAFPGTGNTTILVKTCLCVFLDWYLSPSLFEVEGWCLLKGLKLASNYWPTLGFSKLVQLPPKQLLSFFRNQERWPTLQSPGAMRKIFLEGTGENGFLPSLRSKVDSVPHGLLVFIWAMTRLWNL